MFYKSNIFTLILFAHKIDLKAPGIWMALLGYFQRFISLVGILILVRIDMVKFISELLKLY